MELVLDATTPVRSRFFTLCNPEIIHKFLLSSFKEANVDTLYYLIFFHRIDNELTTVFVLHYDKVLLEERFGLIKASIPERICSAISQGEITLTGQLLQFTESEEADIHSTGVLLEAVGHIECARVA